MKQDGITKFLDNAKSYLSRTNSGVVPYRLDIANATYIGQYWFRNSHALY